MMIKSERLLCEPSIINQLHPLPWSLMKIKADWYPCLKPWPNRDQNRDLSRRTNARFWVLRFPSSEKELVNGRFRMSSNPMTLSLAWYQTF